MSLLGTVRDVMAAGSAGLALARAIRQATSAADSRVTMQQLLQVARQEPGAMVRWLREQERQAGGEP